MKTVAFVEKRNFSSRDEAGYDLFNAFMDFCLDDLTFMAIPNGGVVVASKICIKAHKKLKVIISRKVSLAEMRIIGLGAVTQNYVLLNKERINELQMTEAQIKKSVRKTQELVLQDHKALNNYLVSANDITGRGVCLIDDGVSTGYTMMAAIKEIIDYCPKEIIILTPVIHINAYNLLKEMGAKVFALYTDDKIKFIVDDFYTSFENVSNSQAKEILEMTNVIWE